MSDTETKYPDDHDELLLMGYSIEGYKNDPPYIVKRRATIYRLIQEVLMLRAALAVSRPAPETEDVLDDMFAAGMGAHGKSIEEVAALLADAKLDAARALDGAGEDA